MHTMQGADSIRQTHWVTNIQQVHAPDIGTYVILYVKVAAPLTQELDNVQVVPPCG